MLKLSFNKGVLLLKLLLALTELSSEKLLLLITNLSMFVVIPLQYSKKGI